MIWQNPWAWLGIGALALPILIHLLGRRHFLALREVDDREAVEVGELDEHALRGAVAVRLERNRTNAFVEERPDGLVRLLRVV